MYEIRSVENLEDFLAGSRLTYISYLSSGLINKNSFGLYISRYHILPVAAMYLCIQDKPLYTATIVRATEQYGLPLMEDFPELEQFCKDPLTCEITCLAGSTDVKALFNLFSYLSQLLLHFERYIMVCHPVHARYYERKFGAIRISDVREIKRVNNNPGIALCLNRAVPDTSSFIPPQPKWFSQDLISRIKPLAELVWND